MAETKETGMSALDIVVWKYPLDIAAEQLIEMPAGASPLSAQFQHGGLVLWMASAADVALASGRREKRTVYVVGTGHPFRMPLPARHVSTAQDPDQPLVWHVYISDAERPHDPR